MNEVFFQQNFSWGSFEDISVMKCHLGSDRLSALAGLEPWICNLKSVFLTTWPFSNMQGPDHPVYRCRLMQSLVFAHKNKRLFPPSLAHHFNVKDKFTEWCNKNSYDSCTKILTCQYFLCCCHWNFLDYMCHTIISDNKKNYGTLSSVSRFQQNYIRSYKAKKIIRFTDTVASLEHAAMPPFFFCPLTTLMTLHIFHDVCHKS